MRKRNQSRHVWAVHKKHPRAVYARKGKIVNIIIILAFMICIIGLAYLTLGFSAAGLGYIFLKAKGAAPAYVPPKPIVGWAIQYSSNMPTSMTLGSDGGYFFDFPNVDGVHYVVENISGLRQGQIINMTFSVTGDGTVLSVQGGTPGKVTLYMQRAGDNLSGAGAYQQYRYWAGGHSTSLVAGDYTISVQLNPDQWGDVFGASGSQYPNGFADCVTNANLIGFTFGDPGLGATGHGCYVPNGNARFTLKSFTVTD